MGRSIEDIWKKGFRNTDALEVPQIDKLYSQKSIHIIDEFQRMFRVNLIAIVVFSVVFLVVSYFLYIPVMGIIFFMVSMFLVVINKSLLHKLEKVDKGQNTYEYLKAFDRWIKMQVKMNEQISRFLYPTIFLSLVFGFWFNTAEDVYLGERVVNQILFYFPDIYLVSGVPLIGIVLVVLIMGLLAYVGDRIYRWDVNLIYGENFKKLEELIADIEMLDN
jgi:small-conductance mechanosensitive channel